MFSTEAVCLYIYLKTHRHPVKLFPLKAAKALNLFSSHKQVTKHLMIMYTRCLRQNYSYIDKLRKTRLAGSAITQSKEVIVLNVLSLWCIMQYIPQRHELLTDAGICISNFRQIFGCKSLLCSVLSGLYILHFSGLKTVHQCPPFNCSLLHTYSLFITSTSLKISGARFLTMAHIPHSLVSSSETGFGRLRQ